MNMSIAAPTPKENSTPPSTPRALAAALDNPWRLAGIGAALTALIQLVYQWRYDFGPIDDAFIHLRVAHNLATGAGPVFNVGERVEVSSSPMWTMLLALLLWLGLTGKTATAVLGLVAACAAGAATSLLGYLAGGVVTALVAPLLLSVLPSFSAWAGSGMETPLGLFALAVATTSALSARSGNAPLRTGILCGLSVYVRPELLAVIPSLFVITVWSLPAAARMRAAAVFAASAGGVIALLFLSRYAYFHEWLPNTYYAKVAEGGLSQRIRGLRYTGGFVKEHAVLLVVALYALRRGTIRIKWLALVMLNVLAASVWAGGDGFKFARLALPALPLACAMAAWTLSQLRSKALVSWAVAVTCVAQVISSLKLSKEFSRYFVEVEFAKNAETIAGMMTSMPKGTVATVGIGAIAYLTQRPILDLVGLADKHIARAARIPGAEIGHDHSDVSYVLRRAPELVLLMPWTHHKEHTDESELRELMGEYVSWASAVELLRDPRFREQYVPRDFVQGSHHLRMWLRRDLAYIR